MEKTSKLYGHYLEPKSTRGRKNMESLLNNLLDVSVRETLEAYQVYSEITEARMRLMPKYHEEKGYHYIHIHLRIKGDNTTFGRIYTSKINEEYYLELKRHQNNEIKLKVVRR